jgi:hypothetical protein
MTVPEVVKEVACCSRVESSCICCLPEAHDGEHLCACGGSWTYDESGLMVPHMFPGGITSEEATKRMQGLVMGLFSWPGDDE